MILMLAIGFVMTKKRSSNFQNVNSVNKFCEKRRNWKTLTLASLIFRKAQLYLSVKVCAPITKCYGTNTRSPGKKNWYTRTLPQMDGNISSSINGVIRPVLNFLFFFTIRFHKHQKASKSTKKHQKAPKGTKRHQRH